MKITIVKGGPIIDLGNSVYIDPKRRNFYENLSRKRKTKEIQEHMSSFYEKINLPNEVERLISEYLDGSDKPLNLIFK